MDIFDLRKLGCRHSSLVEQARFASGWRCSTKIWRNYTTRSSPSPSCHTHPSSSTSSHTFSNLFLTFHSSFCPLSKRKPSRTSTQDHRLSKPTTLQGVSGKTIHEFTKSHFINWINLVWDVMAISAGREIKTP